MIKAGQDSVIAGAALEILEQTYLGKKLRENIDDMNDVETKLLWDRMLSKKNE